MIGIYKITNLINNKCYIGKSTNIEKRWKCEKKGKVNNHLKSSFNKYGLSNFKFEVILECEEHYLNDYEQHFIAVWETYNPKYGYNKTFGGEGVLQTEEIKQKRKNTIFEKYGSYYKHTEETKNKISKNNAKGMLNKKHSIETRKKISESNKGKVVIISDETKQKISNKLIGIPLTQERKNNISKACKGKNLGSLNPNSKENRLLREQQGLINKNKTKKEYSKNVIDDIFILKCKDWVNKYNIKKHVYFILKERYKNE